MDVTVETKGPLFDGRAEHEIDAWTHRLESDVADRGVELVRTNLHGVLKHPTGHYESLISAVNSGSLHKVWDDDAIYGPWLEGTGSRNQRTRFKGYATFRKTTQQLQREADRLATQKLPEVLGRIS